MKTYQSSSILKHPKGRIAINLPTIFPLGGGSNETGVAVTAYGKGQVSSVMYSVPAHGEVSVKFDVKVNCVTPEQIQNLTNLIKGLLSASQQHRFTELEKTSVSGGASFFGLFAWGGASASYSKTKETLDSFGLSEANQVTIVNAMMVVAQSFSTFSYTGTIYNRNYDYDVTGYLFMMVMDAEIHQSNTQHQLRFLAPNVGLASPGGEVIPADKPAFDLTN